MAYAELLNNFCSSLLGESSKCQNTKAISTNISKKPHLKKVKSDDINSLDENTKNQLNCSINKTKNSEPPVTDDGFKIINEIPPDDSDVSDAFDSDIEDFEANAEGSENGIAELKQTEDGFKIINEIPPDDSDVEDAFKSENDENNFKEVKQTEDGFKIISEIPSDDSDVEDAFDSDINEEEWIEEAQSRLKQKSNDSNNNNKYSLKPGLEKLKKPLLNLIQDFGMEDKIYFNENSKLSLKKSESKGKNKKNKNKPKNSLSDKELQILDYSVKRGKRKKENLVHEELSETKKTSKKDAEVALKKARYEVFKLGISSGTKVEKKDAKIDLVVRLGARPRKKEVMNYKNLIKLRKEEKEKEILKLEETREMGLPVKKKPAIREKKNDEIDINPGLGKFRNGVLKLSKEDIERINTS